MGVKHAPADVRNRGVMLSITLAVVLAAVMGTKGLQYGLSSTLSVGEQPKSSSASPTAGHTVAMNGTALAGAAYTLEQLQAGQSVLGGFAVVIDLMHMVVPASRACSNSIGAQRLVLKQTSNLISALFDAGAVQVTIVNDAGLDMAKLVHAGRDDEPTVARPPSKRHHQLNAAMRELVAQRISEDPSLEGKLVFLASPTSADQLAAAEARKYVEAGYGTIYVGYDTDVLAAGITSPNFYMISVPRCRSVDGVLESVIKVVQPAAYWELVGIADPSQQALACACSGDDWGSGICGVGMKRATDFLLQHPEVTTPRLLFAHPKMCSSLMPGQREPTKDEQRDVCVSYLRHRYVLTPNSDGSGWRTFNPLPDGIEEPTAARLAEPSWLGGFDTLLPAMETEPLRCLVCFALDMPYPDSTFPACTCLEGDDLRDVLAGIKRPDTLEVNVVHPDLGPLDRASIFNWDVTSSEALLEAQQKTTDDRVADCCKIIEHLASNGTAPTLALHFASQMQLHTAGTTLANLQPGSLLNFISSNRSHPQLAACLSDCDWQQRDERAGDRRAAFADGVGSLISERIASGEGIGGLFSEQTNGAGIAVLALCHAPAAGGFEAVATWLEAHPENPLHGWKRDALASLQVASLRGACPRLLEISARVQALGTELFRDMRTASAARLANGQKGPRLDADFLVRIRAAVNEACSHLRPEERAGFASSLDPQAQVWSQLPPAVKQIVSRDWQFKSTPGQQFSASFKRSHDFQQGLRAMLEAVAARVFTSSVVPGLAASATFTQDGGAIVELGEEEAPKRQRSQPAVKQGKPPMPVQAAAPAAAADADQQQLGGKRKRRPNLRYEV